MHLGLRKFSINKCAAGQIFWLIRVRANINYRKGSIVHMTTYVDTINYWELPRPMPPPRGARPTPQPRRPLSKTLKDIERHWYSWLRGVERAPFPAGASCIWGVWDPSYTRSICRKKHPSGTNLLRITRVPWVAFAALPAFIYGWMSTFARGLWLTAICENRKNIWW